MDDHEESLTAILAEAREFLHHVATRVAEVKQLPDSPARQEILDSYKNALTGIHDALVSLHASASKPKDSLPNS